MKKIILPVVLLLVVVAQFIRPARNQGMVAGPNFLGAKQPVPANVAKVLQRACYDCHSNSTTYPWYADVQPVGWWLAWHVNDGRRHFNFSEFAAYPDKRAAHKLEEVVKEVKEGGMPLPSYTWMHPEARLSDDDKKLLMDWAQDLRRLYPAAPPAPAGH